MAAASTPGSSARTSVSRDSLPVAAPLTTAEVEKIVGYSIGPKVVFALSAGLERCFLRVESQRWIEYA